MSERTLPLLAWKWLSATLVLAALLLLCVELDHAFAPLATGLQGSIGIELDDQQGVSPAGQETQRLRVKAVAPGSALDAAGVQAGAAISFARPIDRWRKFAPGETVELVVHEGERKRHVRVSARAAPLSFAEYFDCLGRYVLAVPALLFSLMIGFKQAAGRSYRALSLCFLALSLDAYYTFNFSPAGLTLMVSKLANLTTYVLIWYFCARFALTYQPYARTRLRAVLLQVYPGYRWLAFAAAAYAFWFGLGNEAPGLWYLSFGGVLGGLLLSVASLADGLRTSHGEMRQRHLWLLLSFAAGAVPSMLTWIAGLDLAYRGVRLTIMASFAGQLLMYIGLAYAVLRHRVFNFSFAISRAVIFSVLSLLLLCSFGLCQWLFGSLMKGHGEAAHQNGLADATVALLLYLGFHQIHHRVERVVERIFFHQWHENERKLREFVRRAAHITVSDTLLAALVGALERFTRQAGVAVYLTQPDGGYALVTGTLPDAAPTLDFDDSLYQTLRDSKVPVRCAQLAGMAFGELALPISHRGTLDGVVIIGSKAYAEPYRPDECKVLGFAVQQIGRDLEAMRVELLEARMHELARQADRQEAELRLLAGRRSSVRPLAPRAAPAGT